MREIAILVSACYKSNVILFSSGQVLDCLSHLLQNVDSKGMRDQRLDMQRRAAETGDDDLIPFGDRPTVSRFGAISRTSKAMYQNSGPMQAMAVQGASTKSIISGRMCALGFCRLLLFSSVLQYSASWRQHLSACFLSKKYKSDVC